MKLVTQRRRHRQAKLTAGVAHHEIDRLGGGFFRRDHKIAFVFAILVVDEHDHAPRAQFGNRFVDGAEIPAMVVHAYLGRQVVNDSHEREAPDTATQSRLHYSAGASNPPVSAPA